MTTHVDRDRTITALTRVWAAIEEVLAGLSPDQWDAASPCPGWAVRDVVAHVVGTELMLQGETPEVDVADVGARPHLRNDIGRFNEAWVATLRDRDPADLLATFREVTASRTDELLGLDQGTWDAVGFTPAGKDTHGRFMRIRVFDCWLHEQDIRAAVGLPAREDGLEVEVTLDEMETALGFVVGKRAGLGDGVSVTFDLTGPSGRVRHVVVADGRASLVDDPDATTVTLSMPVVTFARLAGGRTSLDQVEVEITGDRATGGAVLAAINYTI